MISWTSPLSRGMSRQSHSSTIFEVWVLRARLTTIGRWYSPLCGEIQADLALLSVFEHTVSLIQYSPAVFDAFVNQTNVSPFVGLLPVHPETGI